MRSFFSWIAWVALSFSTALPGAASPPGDWYQSLNKPEWTPPGWVFPVVWTTLYVMMGTAAWLVWRKRKEAREVRVPITLFVVQLALNASWTPTFFGARQILPALWIIVTLWIAIVLTLLSFRRVSAGAMWLLVPYLAWVSIATALNFQIWRLNA